MISPFERFVALRYLRGARGRSEGKRFLQFVTYVAVGGVALGVAALLLALAIVRGFSSEIQEKLVGFGAHVQVESFQQGPLGEVEERRAVLDTLEGVERVAPVVQEFALARHRRDEIEGLSVWGVEEPPRYLAGRVVEGVFTFQADSAGRPGLVLGMPLAEQLGLEVGDRLTVFSMRGLSGMAGLRQRPRVKQFYVAGIYETLLTEFDEVNAFTSLPQARALHGYVGDQVTRFDLTLSNPERADVVARQVEDLLGFPVIARTIFEVYAGLFAWVNLQESIIPLVIAVIVIVATFNIVGTLLIIVLEKARELGVMASLGASPKTLRRVYLTLGLLIGLVGTAIGEVLALVLALVQQHFELIPLPAEAYYMDTAPVELHVFDFVWVGALALVLCALAAYVPARVASRLDPLRAIRLQ